MDKNIIKNHLNARFLSEAKNTTPGISVTADVKKKSGKINKDGVNAIDKDVKTYDKDLKKSEDMVGNKFNYNGDKEKEYHDQMEIMNGQEMIQYDSEPSEGFKKRDKDAIEGSSKMGNAIGANAESAWGASSDDFGKNLVKNIKASDKKRTDAEKQYIRFGSDIEMLPNGAKPANRNNALSEVKSDSADKKIVGDKPKSSDSSVKSPTSTDVRSPTRTATSTDAYTSGNVTVTGGAGAGANTTVTIQEPSAKQKAMDKVKSKTGASYEDNDDNEDNKNNDKPKIKESMKRLKFKKEFNGVGNALKMIPESYKVDNKQFEMTDGNESYKIRWEGTLSEGKAIVLTASDSKMINEDMQKMKHLMGYKSQETLGLVKGKSRLDENAAFGDIWNKSKTLLEGEEIEDADAKEGDLDDAVAKAPEATKHVEGSVSADKGGVAPAPKTGSLDSLDKVKSQAPEAKAHVEGSESTEKGGVAPAPKTGVWDEISVPQAADAKKHITMSEGVELGGQFFAPINESWMEEEEEMVKETEDMAKEEDEMVKETEEEETEEKKK